VQGMIGDLRSRLAGMGSRRGDGSSSPLNWFMMQMLPTQIPRISMAVLAGSIRTVAYFLHWWIHR
jgi:hypothetical protein